LKRTSCAPSPSHPSCWVPSDWAPMQPRLRRGALNTATEAADRTVGFIPSTSAWPRFGATADFAGAIRLRTPTGPAAQHPGTIAAAIRVGRRPWVTPIAQQAPPAGHADATTCRSMPVLAVLGKREIASGLFPFTSTPSRDVRLLSHPCRALFVSNVRCRRKLTFI
jgi:hypothetical protein